MDIEELNKTQIILLTLLVSFVTSIATGIVTVSLMGQAPQGITQTVNRIVERTVEKVVPDPLRGSSSSQTNTVEKTVVVKEEDLTADSIAKARGGTVRLVAKGALDSAFYGYGFVVDGKGTIVADKNTVDPTVISEAILGSGERISLTRHASEKYPITVFRPESLGTSTPAFSALGLGDTSKLRLGQTVIRVGGTGRSVVSVGIISSLPDASEGKFIETTASTPTSGSVLITIFGDVVGMTTGESQFEGPGVFTSAERIKDAIGNL